MDGGSVSRPISDVGVAIGVLLGLLVAFGHPLSTLLVILGRNAGLLEPRGGPLPEFISAGFPVQLLTVPIGLVVIGLALGINRPLPWIALFVIAFPVIFVASVFGQLAMCGVVGQLC
jgi:hypothetical protein